MKIPSGQGGYGNPGITNTAVQLITTLMSMAYWLLSICNFNSRYNLAG
ncbi:MAG TPA: hypothetical protein PL128_08795 [Ginsengibacter sp.]|nr:hypothetical protein [Ginsengibacter sp.]